MQKLTVWSSSSAADGSAHVLAAFRAVEESGRPVLLAVFRAAGFAAFFAGPLRFRLFFFFADPFLKHKIII